MSIRREKRKASAYAALRLKDAVADYFKEKTGQRPDVSVRNLDILLNLHIRNNKAVKPRHFRESRESRGRY